MCSRRRQLHVEERQPCGGAASSPLQARVVALRVLCANRRREGHTWSPLPCTQATTFSYNVASKRGGAWLVAGGAVVLSNSTLLANNSAGESHSCGTNAASPSPPPSNHLGNSLFLAVDAGSVTYALPAHAGRWVASGFPCKQYRFPCPVDNAACDPDEQPALAPER